MIVFWCYCLYFCCIVGSSSSIQGGVDSVLFLPPSAISRKSMQKFWKLISARRCFYCVPNLSHLTFCSVLFYSLSRFMFILIKTHTLIVLAMKLSHWNTNDTTQHDTTRHHSTTQTKQYILPITIHSFIWFFRMHLCLPCYATPYHSPPACTPPAVCFSPTPRDTRDSTWSLPRCASSGRSPWSSEHRRETIRSTTCWHPSTAWDCSRPPASAWSSAGAWVWAWPPSWRSSRNYRPRPGAYWMLVWWWDWRWVRRAFSITMRGPFSRVNCPRSMPAFRWRRPSKQWHAMSRHANRSGQVGSGA